MSAGRSAVSAHSAGRSGAGSDIGKFNVSRLAAACQRVGRTLFQVGCADYDGLIFLVRGVSKNCISGFVRQGHFRSCRDGCREIVEEGILA